MGRIFVAVVFCWISIFSQFHAADMILSPEEGILLQPMSTVSIKWKTGYQGNIKITFSTDDGKSWREICSETDASAGEFIWSIPDVISNLCRIRIQSVQSVGADFQSSIFTIDDINKYYGVKWNGLIPHFQPFATTDYYGSGDADLNGLIDQADITYIDKIIAGIKNQNIRADVNGDQLITTEDRILLQNAVNGDTLSAWWNIINNKAEKINWLKKMLVIDKTDEHEYIPGKYECGSFAAQLFRNFTGINEYSPGYFSSQSVYNLPVYYVLINPPSGIPHNLNAILTGNDPRNYSDWTFIEPQNDELVSLNKYPAGTEVFILSLSFARVVKFDHSGAGIWSLKSINSSTVLHKPNVFPEIDCNAVAWNPVLLSDGRVIFERAADDMTREYKIHVSPADSLTAVAAKPLLHNYCRSHIVSTSTSETITHLIWEEIQETGAEYFYGHIEPGGRDVMNVNKLPFLISGSVTGLKMFIRGDDGYLFWFNNITEDAGKIFYSRYTGGGWSTPEFINIGKENALIIDYEPGDDQEGNFHLFIIIKTTNWNKLLILSSDKGWNNTYNSDYVAGSEIFFADHCFFVAQRRGYPWDSVTDAGMYTRLNGKWNIISSTFYGIPLQVISTGEQDAPLCIIGADKIDNEYFLKTAFVKNSYITDHLVFEDIPLSLSADMSALYVNKNLLLVWKDINTAQIKYFSYNPGLSSAEWQNSDFTPQLLQNYPNPFNNVTSIKYSLAEEGRAAIKLFDLLGSEIKTVIDENHRAGEHSVYFNASDLSSGIYLYQLTAGKRIITKKMILLK